MTKTVEAVDLPTQDCHGRWPWRRCLLLVLGIWMALCGGTLYAFSAFEVELKRQCMLTAQQLDIVYASGQLGAGMGVLAGLLHDHCGPVITSLYGCVLTVIGNFGLHAMLKLRDCGGLTSLSLLHFALQQGSVAIYQAGLFSNLRAWPPALQGRVAGIVAAGYGLSAALASAVYAHVCHGDLSRYFRSTALVFGATGLLGALAIPRLVMKPTPRKARRYAHLPEAEEGTSAAARHGSSRDRTIECMGPLQEPFVAPYQETVPTVIGKAAAAAAALPAERPTVAGAGPWRLAEVLRSPELWLFVATFSQLQAVGSGIFIANMGLIADSFRITEARRLLCVRVLSYCNCIGRIITGCLMDFCEPYGVPRAAHTLWTGCAFLVAAGSLRLAPADKVSVLLLPELALLGFAYGSNWAVMPSFVARRFNNCHVGVSFNLNTSVMACNVLLTSFIVGGLYDQAAAPGGMCVGAGCWRNAFTLGVCLSITGLATALALAACGCKAASTPESQGETQQ